MSDDLTAGWTFDQDLVRQMRLETAGRALAGQDPYRAFAEAEELLQHHPADLSALRLAGAAALTLGDGATAAAALAPVVDAAPDDSGAWVQLGWARFLTADIPGGIDALGRATALDPEDADAWYRLSVASAWLDQAASRAAAERAAGFDLEAYPFPMELPDESWAHVLAQSLALQTPAIQAFYQEVPVHWRPRPTVEDLRRIAPSHPPLVFALGAEEPPDPGELIDDEGELIELAELRRVPSAVWLYQENIARIPAAEDELVERISEALRTEAQAWLDALDVIEQLTEQDD